MAETDGDHADGDNKEGEQLRPGALSGDITGGRGSLDLSSKRP